jgi:methylated-DNA-[protein]-cysteine S-methyltransferase
MTGVNSHSQPMLHSLTLPDTPLGPLTLLANAHGLCRIEFGLGRAAQTPEHPILQAAAHQLEAYFSAGLKRFDLPLAPAGTLFQRRVWAALLQIPWGSTRRYADIATWIGSPKACRAVGGANNRNPLPIIIPCHRVVGSRGELTGYAPGLAYKIRLLQLEQITIEPAQRLERARVIRTAL